MGLSIVIVNWNTCSALQKCLESIVKFTQNVEYEIIVIDNGSSDSSVDMLKSLFPSIILTENNKNVGFSKAVNQGFKIANSENILLLNSDTYISENSFAKMVDLMERKKHIGAMTCRVSYPDGSPQSAYCRFPSLPGALYELISIVKLLSHLKIFHKYDVTQWDYSKSKELMDGLWPGGGCLMIKREVLNKIGGMDENFKYAYLEDTDLCYRVKNAGYSFYYLAEVNVYHYHGFTVSQSNSEFKDLLILNLQQNRHYFFKKHYGAVRLMILKTLDMFKNILFESYFLSTYIFTLKNRQNKKKKIKLYSKMITGCFVENLIE